MHHDSIAVLVKSNCNNIIHQAIHMTGGSLNWVEQKGKQSTPSHTMNSDYD